MKEYDGFSHITAQSRDMKAIIALAKKYARLKEPLLIMSETGTGKDMLALACHEYSERANNPFLAINCAALPDDVVESELYGHAIGAYPNAVEDKKCFFKQAENGTVLLDEVGEMSPRMQAKLLRFIHDGTFRRVGDDKQQSVDVRIICTTQQTLDTLVKANRFREDLYYRLSVFSIMIPPLRERVADILPLAHYFLADYAKQHHADQPVFSSEAEQKLLGYAWPGNVRQLKNVIYSTMIQTQQKQIQARDILLPFTEKASSQCLALDEILHYSSLDEMNKHVERTILTQLYKTYPSTRKLSQRLKISHTAIANKLREYQIKK